MCKKEKLIMKQVFKINKKIIALILVVILLIAGCKITIGTGADIAIKAVLLYNGNAENEQYLDTYSQLQHSFVANFEIEKLDANKKNLKLGKYDIVYVDSAVSELTDLKDELVKYVENGGNNKLILASYDSAKNLGNVAIGENGKASIEKLDGYTYKAMLWESMESAEPVTKAIKY